ncbi:hypothetical protein IYZ83_002860 [Wolbachia pipientis]|uniref:hypothetical protein n=1 Tax=Wolbachia pipientis TaxID=955 RepID=UPI001F447003|nr:hypothetical protein [Wolbachia pipientis]UIP92135.1 hypothetical protein IYZ83_002860 [Wolbachia pipientis]
MTDDSTDVIMSTTPSLGRSSSSGSTDSKPEKPAYAVTGKSKKTPKKSPDNKIDSQHPTLSRSVSQEKEFDRLLDRNESEKNPFENLSQHSDTPSTSPPSYTSRSNSQGSSPTNSKSKLQKNRFWPKAQYAIQQKGVVIFGAAAIVLGTSTFIAFFTNSLLYTIVPIIEVASLFAISPMLLGIKQFVNTKEYQIQGKNADEVLDNVFRHRPEGKVIKSVRLKYSNGTHSNFVLNAWESKKGFVNIRPAAK